ncbi:MAG: YaeQ family protein [Congregibacter sp.]|nr:YaeQ family protein [Congregibacter sp.]
MALKSTVFKVKLNIADLDRNVYDDFALSVARHPSETDARMMLRIAAFALHANEHLQFGRGISTDDEPDLWQKDLTSAIELWIELGTPDPDRLRKACGRAKQVLLYAYGERAVKVWWDKNAAALARFDNLAVFGVSDLELEGLKAFAAPGLALQCTISEGEILLTSGQQSLQLKPVALRRAGA